MEILFLLAVAAAVAIFLFASVSSYRAYRSSFTASAKVGMEDMFLFIDPHKLFYANVVTFLLVPVIVYFMTDSGGLAGIAAVFMLFAPRLTYKWLQARRLRKFQDQLPDAMTMIASALRAGASLPMALDLVAEEQPAPMSQEMGLVVREQRLGVPLEQSLDAMARRVDVQDFYLVASAVIIAKEVGGNLSEILDRLAGTLRAKAVMEGKIRALTSQGKLQGIVVGLLPVFLAGVLTVMDPVAMRPLFHSYYGWAVIAVIAVLELLGAVTIKKIVSIDV